MAANDFCNATTAIFAPSYLYIVDIDDTQVCTISIMLVL